MPRINTEVLIKRLEDIDEKLSLIWSETQNYDILEELERVREDLRKIIDSLEYCIKES